MIKFYKKKSIFTSSLVFLCFLILPGIAKAQDCSVNAGIGKSYCPNSEIVLDGGGSGLYYDTSIRWTIVSQPSGASVSIVNPRQYATKTNVATVPGDYVFKLSIKCSDGVYASQNVTFTVGTPPPAVPAITDAGTASPLCVSAGGGTTITFSGHTAPGAGYTEEWSYSSSTFSGTFSSTTTSNPTFTFGSLDPYKCPGNGIITIYRVFKNTASGCASVSSRVYNVVANYPVDYKLSTCSGISFIGTCTGDGTGAWTVSASPSSPAPILSSTSGSTSRITNPVSGTTYTVRYTVSGNSCTNGFKEKTFTYSPSSALSSTSPNAGPDQVFTTTIPATISLDGNTPNTAIGESGYWTQIAGGTATIANPTDPKSNVSGLVSGGAYIFRWTIIKSDGCSSYDDMTVKGPILLDFTEGTTSCTSEFVNANNPSSFSMGHTSNFPYGIVDSVNFKIILISAPKSLGSAQVPVRLYLKGGSSCAGSSGCPADTVFVGSSSATAFLVGKPGLYLNSADVNAINLNFQLSFYPIVSGDYVFAYEYATNAGEVRSGTVRLKAGRILTANAGTDVVLGCGVATTALAGNNLFFANTTDPSDPFTYAPVYNGEWTTVSMPAGATDPINLSNKYQKNPSLSGLIQGKYTFRLSISGDASTGCGTDDFMDVYVTNTAPSSVAMPADFTACKGADITISVPETGFYPKGWALVSGPSTPVFSPDVQSRKVTMSGLLAGTYIISFTDSSRCGNATGTVTITVSSTDSVTQAKLTACNYDASTSTRFYTVNAKRPNYANGETARFFRLVKGVEVAFSSAPNAKTVVTNGLVGADTSIKISNWPGSSDGDAVVLVYQISRLGCGTTSDTIVLRTNESTLDYFTLNRNVELCNQTLPYTVTPYPNSSSISGGVPTTGSGSGNNEWLGQLNAQWSVVSLPSGATAPSFGSQGDINSTVTFNSPGEYVLHVTFPELNPGNTFCGGSTGVIAANKNFMTLYYKIGNVAPAATNAGPDRTICAPGIVTLMATPTRGFWSVVGFNNAPAPVFANDTLNTSTITFPSSGDAQLKWIPRPVYAWCAEDDFDMVNISYLGLPKIEGGKIQNFCSVPASLNLGLNAKGSTKITSAFTQISGPTTTTINRASEESVGISGFSAGTYLFKYTFTSDSCGATSDTVTLNIGTCISVSGHLWDDADGDAVNDATENKTSITNLMWAYLTNADGVVIDKTQIDGTGYYSFNEVLSGSAYKVVLGQAGSAEPGAVLTTVVLPPNWIHTGTNLAGIANTTNTTGIINLGTVTTVLTNQDFGIEQKPTAVAQSYTLTTAPAIGSTLFLNGAGTAGNSGPLKGSDPEDQPTAGSLSGKSIGITGLPTNGEMWYNGVQITKGADGINPPSASNPFVITAYDPSLLGVKFTGTGYTSTSFNYTDIDAAGVASTPVTYAINFPGITLSGNVFNDVKGLSDLTVNGPGTNADGSGLYAILVDNGTGKVIAAQSIPAGGTYSFGNVLSGNYSVVLSTTNPTIGSSAPSASLPSNWLNTGENVGTAAGNDGTVNGVINLGTTTTTKTNINFGIEQAPFADNKTLPVQPNPLDTGTIVITNDFYGTDSITHYISSITITSFPDHVTSLGIGSVTYYPSGTPIPSICPTASCMTFPASGGVNITTDSTGKPLSVIRIDPKDGDNTIIIPYVTIDQAGVASLSPGSVEVPLMGVPLPLSIEQFTVVTNQCINRLYWRTSGDKGVQSYEVMRSHDGKSFVALAELKAKNELKNEYEYADQYDQFAIYKLKINASESSAYTYSPSRTTNGCNSQTESSVILYPNPTVDVAHFDHLENVLSVRVYNALGQLIKELTETDLKSGSFATASFASGTYFAVLHKVSGNTERIQFQKK